MNIVFDIGGTNMRVAPANGDVLGAIRKVGTPRNPEEGLSTLVALARELCPEGVRVIVGDVPGSLDAAGSLYDAPHLAQWEGVNVAERLAREVGVPVSVLNDAVLVGYGEAVRGAGKGFNNVVYMTVSTGVGGARVNKQDLSRSAVLHDDLEALKKRLEDSISGTAVQKKFGVQPKDLESLDERNTLAEMLARGLHEIAHAWKPDVFVLGGSMIVGKNPIPLERVRATFTLVPVTMAALGDNGGLTGGAVRAQLLSEEGK